MKKSITVLFLLLLAVCGITGAFAQSENDFEVTAANGAVTITMYTGSGGSVVIPARILGLPVTAIGEKAFDGCTGLTSISIPTGVTSIGDYVFYGCTGLTSVSIPVSVTSIGDYVFYGCTGLTSVSIPVGITDMIKANLLIRNRTVVHGVNLAAKLLATRLVNIAAVLPRARASVLC